MRFVTDWKWIEKAVSSEETCFAVRLISVKDRLISNCGETKVFGVMKNRKQKGYWTKRLERYADGRTAKTRAAELRQHQHVAHVQCTKSRDGYDVTFSVAAFYLEELERVGVKL